MRATVARPMVWLAAAAVLAGCGGDGKSATTTVPSTTTTTTTMTTVAPSTSPPATAAPTTAAPTSNPPATAAPSSVVPTSATVPTTSGNCSPQGSYDVQSDGFPGQLSTLVGAAVRTGARPCTERVVFEFQGYGSFPGYWVRYQDPPITDDPRGEPVSIAGSSFLVVTIESWMTTMEGDGYSGPTRFAPSNVSHIKEMVMLGNFESVTTWAIGIDQRLPFTVSTLTYPSRLVIDIAVP